MKSQEIKKLIECKAVESCRVMRDKDESGWIINFHMTWEVEPDVKLETSRGEIRKFKTLDAIIKFLHEIGIVSFEVLINA